MKHLTIVVPEGENNLSSITGAYEILTRANRTGRKADKKNCLQLNWRVFQKRWSIMPAYLP